MKKESRNKGREFYTCPKPREQQCNFLEWADNVAAGGGSPRKNYQSQSPNSATG